ncbi:MAG: 5-methylthioadenosine phosphorylase [Ilumatobacteraceae bacterium]|nr:5-methylthioadenosine phosphorylase [Ilumatobacteraceae bacterium]
MVGRMDDIRQDHIGVIGGSGLYSFLTDVEHVDVATPFGNPSGPVALGMLDAPGGARRVAFLPRHGLDHQLPPHGINYRANLWALHSLGVTRIFGPSACGSLRADIAPGDLVVCDQFVDQTTGRPGTYFDGPIVNHVSMADPYCPQMADAVIAAARFEGMPVHPTGTVVVIAGPRFATRAESGTYRRLGYDVINMTQCPEVALARELGMCYSSIALVTDYDSGVDDRPEIEAVNQADVFEVFAANVDRLRGVLRRSIIDLADRSCSCAAATNGIMPTPGG